MDIWVIVGIVVFVILLIVTGALQVLISGIASAISAFISVYPTVHQATKEVCNLDSTILAVLVTEVEAQKPNDPKIQNIINVYKTGSKLTECDVVKLVSYLDENEKKRLNLQDVVCTAVNCLGN